MVDVRSAVLAVVEEDGAVPEGAGEVSGKAALTLGAACPRFRGLRVVGQKLGYAGDTAPLRLQTLLPLPVAVVMLGLRRTAGHRRWG